MDPASRLPAPASCLVLPLPRRERAWRQAAIAVVALGVCAAVGADWPQFRGPSGLGVAAPDARRPLVFGPTNPVTSQRGRMCVVRASETFEVLARNDLGDVTQAAPAAIGDVLYVRTAGHLYAFREAVAR